MLKFSSNLVFNYLPIVLITCSSFKSLYGRIKQWEFLLSSSGFWAMLCWHNCFSLTSTNTLNITQSGNPLILLRLDRMCFNCISRYWSVEKMSKALCTKVFIFPHFYLFGAKEFQWIYKQKLVYYGILSYVLFNVLMTTTPKDGINKSISMVNLILLWKLFAVVIMRLIDSTFAKWILSSTYLFHILILFSKRGIITFQVLLWKYLPVQVLKGNP